MAFTYNWQASLLALVLILVSMAVLRFFIFLVPAFKRTREIDARENERKLASRGAIYTPRLKPSVFYGFVTYAIGHSLMLPFFITLDIQPLWRIAVDAFAILMLYDFLYYLMHRFLFHGKWYFNKVHSVHHQARSRVSSIDSALLHPVEVFLGVFLYYLTIVLLGLAGMGPFGVASIVVTSLIYVMLNQFNHCRVDLDYFPFKTLNWIAMKHDAHHLDMRRGNYATITLLYDWLFGTIEMHPRELAEKSADHPQQA